MKNLKKTDDRVNRLQVSNNNLKKIIRNSDKQFIFTCYIKYHIQINYGEITDARKKIRGNLIKVTPLYKIPSQEIQADQNYTLL